jgi:Caspase domain/Tetratricopeptide repeat
MPVRDALIIASAQYSDPVLCQLKAPQADAASLSEVLSNPDIGGFRARALIDRPHYEVTAAIEEFFLDRERDDLLLLYFTGHGIKDPDGRLYFATANTKRNLLLATSVPASMVNDAMLRSRSRRQILILDCCHSGAFARGMVAKSDDSVGTSDYFQGTGRIVLTASDATQYALEAEQITGTGVRSIFTEVLVEGLKSGEADSNCDGLISLDELFAYSEDRVRQRTPSQKPMKWALGASGEMIVARNKNPVLRPAELPRNLIDALDKDNLPSIRQAAAKELGRILGRPDRAVALAAELQLKELLTDDSRSIQEIAQQFLAEKASRQAEEQARQATVEQERVAEDERVRAARQAQREKEEQAQKAEAERARLAEEERLRQAEAEKARRDEEEQKKAEAEAARLAEEARVRQEAAEKARRDKEEQEQKAQAERVRLAEQERLRQAAAERAQKEKEDREKAEAERARLLAEEVRQRQAAAVKARKEKEERDKAEAEKSRLAEQERLRQAAAEKARREKQEPAIVAPPEQAGKPRPSTFASMSGFAKSALSVVGLLIFVVTIIRGAASLVNYISTHSRKSTSPPSSQSDQPASQSTETPSGPGHIDAKPDQSQTAPLTANPAPQQKTADTNTAKPPQGTINQSLPEIDKRRLEAQQKPKDPDAQWGYGNALMEAHDYDGAIEQFRAAVNLPPKDIGRAFLYRDLGEAYEKKGDFDNALQALKKSVVSWPVKNELYCSVFEREMLGRIFEEKGDNEGAMAYWKDLMSVAKDPQGCQKQYDRIAAKVKQPY